MYAQEVEPKLKPKIETAVCRGGPAQDDETGGGAWGGAGAIVEEFQGLKLTDPSKSPSDYVPKKRLDFGSADKENYPLDASSSVFQMHEITGAGPIDVTPQLIRKLRTDLYSMDRMEQIDAVKLIRKVVSTSTKALTYGTMVIEARMIPRLVDFIRQSDDPELQYDAVWAITNLLCGNSEQTEDVANEGTVEALIDVLKSPEPSPRLVEQTVWALSNIAGDCIELRDQVVDNGLADVLLDFVDPSIELSIRRMVSWAYSNVCRYNNHPPEPLSTVVKILGGLSQLIDTNDLQILLDAVHAFGRLCDHGEMMIDLVLGAPGLVPKLIDIIGWELTDQNFKVINNAVHALGNIASGCDDQTQILIDAGAIPHLIKLFHCERTEIIKDAALVVSNIAACEVEQVQALLDAGIVPELIQLLQSENPLIQKEAMWTVTNTCGSGSDKQLKTMFEQGIIPPMCHTISPNQEPELIIEVIEGLRGFLGVFAKIGELDTIANVFEECGGLDKIETLQSHENIKVYDAAYNLIEDYFTNTVKPGKSNSSAIDELNKLLEVTIDGDDDDVYYEAESEDSGDGNAEGNVEVSKNENPTTDKEGQGQEKSVS